MKWYEIKSKADVSEIWLYDEIGFWGVGAKEFIVELNALKSPKIDMHINSPGGEVFDGAAIYNAVKRHPAKVTSFIDGIAASITSVMAKNAIYMMHNPSGLVLGTSEDMRKTADILDKVRETMVGAYMGKSGKSEDEIKALLDGETWLNAEETMEAGFADELGEEYEMAACAKFIPVLAKMGFKNVPQRLQALRQIPTARDLEQALRDVGCSSKVAKSVLARGYTDDLRDEGIEVEPPTVADPPRDVEPEPTPAKKDRVNDLLIRAELAAPSN